MTDARPPVCAAVAAFGLPGVPTSDRSDPLDDRPWAHLLACVKDQRLTGLMVAMATTGSLDLTAHQTAQLARVHRRWMSVALRIERTLLLTGEQFQGAGIEYRVLKGSAVAHLDYPDPALRSFGDVDLLVRAEQFDEAVRLLTGAGHQRRYPEPRAGFDRRFGKGCCLLTEEGLQIDLHRSLAMGPYGVRIRLDDLWVRTSTFRLANRELPALGVEERFLHACFHAALGDPVPRLGPLRDVAQILAFQPVDVDTVKSLIQGWRAAPVVARAVATAHDVLGFESSHPLLQWAQDHRMTRPEHRAMSVYVDTSQTYAAKSFEALRALPGWRAKVAFAMALLFPRRDYLAERHAGRLGRWRKGMAEIVRQRRHP